MKSQGLKLITLLGRFAVCQLDAKAGIPSWAVQGEFFSVSRTSDELSIVCSEQNVPADQKVEKGWRSLKVQGPLDFGLTGILSSLAKPLADAGISIFAISTFDTDYLMVKEEHLEKAVSALTQAGHRFIGRMNCSNPP